MKNRLFAILIVVCLAVAVAGCASEDQKESYRNEILLPRQTGSNFNRRFMEENESTPKKKTEKKRRDSTKPSKKPVKTEQTEPERVAPERPEETPTPAPPDRFR
jgi:hypothetical protein